MDVAVLSPMVRFVLDPVVRFMLDPVVRPALVLILILVLVLVPRGGTRGSTGLASASVSEERDDDHQREEDRKDSVHDFWLSGVL